jgi:ABC-type transport system involved in multi-copper enzyme maturation permease subunit
VKLFGPVFFYDMIRVARRGRYVVLRCLYALLLLLLMYVVYEKHFSTYAIRIAGDRELTQQLMAEFAEKFFGAFLATQFIAIMLLTPAYTAGAIAEEKQRKTIEYLFATDLGNHEIVLGKLAARVGNLILLIVTGLPILSLTQLFGGISPMLLWCGFAATGLAMLSLATLSILQSVYAKRVRDAMIRTYVIVIGYFAGWGVLGLIRLLLAMDPPAPRVVIDIFDAAMKVYNAGNPAMGIYDLIEYIRTSPSGNFGYRPLVLLGYFALFHGTLAILCMSLSVVKLRSAYVRQVYGKVVKAMKLAQATKPPRRIKPKPPITERPMVWKEMYAERGLRLGVLGELAFIIIALGLICPAIVLAGIVVLEWWHNSGGLEMYQHRMNLYVRYAGTILSCVIAAGVGIRAAGTIAAERDRLTYETLMSSTLTNHEILFGKWIGAVTSMRWVYALLAAMWLLGLVCGGLHWLAFPLVLVVLVLTVMLAASLGLWFGSGARTGLRASMATVVGLLVLLLGPFMLGGLGESSGLYWLRAGSPAGMIYHLSFHRGETHLLLNPSSAPQVASWNADGEMISRREVYAFYASLVMGSVLAVGTLAITLLASRRFRLTCGRIVARPEPLDTRYQSRLDPRPAAE